MKNFDQIKERLDHDGQADEAADKVEDLVADLRDKAEDTVDSIKDKIHELSRNR